MALVSDTWTGNQDNGDPLDGVVNAAYLSALRAGVNSIDDSQIIAGANIQGSKFADLSIATSKLANNSITEGKLLKADAANGVRVVAATAAQRKELWGAKSVTITNPALSGTATVTFATDSADSGTAFANATDLIVVATVNHDAATAAICCYVETVTATTFVIRLHWADNAAHATTSRTVYWHAIGRTA